MAIHTMQSKVIIAGLGNPGKCYEKTRHNIGFIFIDELIQKYMAQKISVEKLPCELWKTLLPDHNEECIIAKPKTYMNLSGEALQPLIAWYKIPPSQLLIIHDDIDLPLGTIKFKFGGGNAGHNGLKSITQRLSTPNFYRLRIGIGRSPYPTEKVEQWVLGKFLQKELQILYKVLPTSIEVIELFIKKEIQAALHLANSFKLQEFN